MRGSAIVSFIWLIAAQQLLGEVNQPHLIVDIYAPRAEIRVVLLKRTAVGSGIKEVEEFISRQLQRSGDVSAMTVQPAQDVSKTRVAKTIRVYLGQYYKHLGAGFFNCANDRA
jgi:hypothetical protein